MRRIAVETGIGTKSCGERGGEDRLIDQSAIPCRAESEDSMPSPNWGEKWEVWEAWRAKKLSHGMTELRRSVIP